MKTLKKWLAVAVMFICCSTISAYDFEVDGICYDVKSPSKLTCQVTYYSRNKTENSNYYKGDIVIPASVISGGKTYSVTEIDQWAFCGCSYLKSIVLPEGITYIWDGAFSGCTSLKYIKFPESLTKIDMINSAASDGAFYGCTSLTSIVIPKNVTYIGKHTFYSCNNLKEVFILGSPTVASYAFSYCHSALEVYHAEDMITFDKNIINYGDTHNVSYTNNLKAYTATLHDYKLETDAGTHTTNLMFTYSDGVNFDVEIPYTYTINKAPLTIKVNDAEKVYGDENPQFTYSVSGFVNNEDENALSSDVSFTTTAEKGSKVGTYPVSASATAKNYEILSNDGTLTVTKAPITVAVCPKTIVYGDNNPQFDFTYVGLKNNDIAPEFTSELNTSTKATKYSSVGDYEVTVSGGVATNYTFTEYIPGTLTVSPAPLNISVQSATREYGEDNPKFNFSYSGFKNDDNIDCLATLPTIATLPTPTSSVGKYEIVPQGAKATNYAINYTSGTLTINKAPLNIQPESKERVYGEENPKFTFAYSGFKNDETFEVLTNRPTATTTATATSSVGEYAITASGAEAQNYNILYKSGTLNVTKAPLAVSVTSTQKVYGDANPTIALTYSGFKNHDTENCISKKPAVKIEADKYSDVGEYAITLSGGAAQNYEFTAYNPGVLTIVKAPLRVVGENKKRLYFEANPEFTYLCEGLKNNDTKDVLTTKPNFECTAKQTSTAGEYDITLSGAEAKNYELSYQNGKLTVGKRMIDVKVASCTKTYNDENPDFSASYSGFVNNESEKVFTKVPTLSCVADKTTDAGVYEIIASNGEATNYDFNYINGTLTIEKATQQIIWDQNLDDVEFGEQLELTATATSGLDVEYEIADNDFVSIYEVAGKVYLDCFGTGQIVIRATQPGNRNYHQAVKVSKKIIVTDPSGINTITNDSKEFAIYNLKGERMNCNRKDLKKGVYIQNGKKFIVK